MREDEARIPGSIPRFIETHGGEIFVCQVGSGPPVLLLHGFPETHLMWRDVAPLLADKFSVFCADLPGYGRSSGPAPDGQHLAYSKRRMAGDLIEAMARLGYQRFAVVGHDRGGRVAYRMALDHPHAVTKLAVLDVIPTGAVFERADARLMLAFWPFSLLAQPAPFPERLIGAAADAVIDNALGHWGTPAETFSAEVRSAYVDALREPGRIHTICEEYRAAASVDREHDLADLRTGRRIACPVLALWSDRGGLNNWYQDHGGPLAIWQQLAADVDGHPFPGGHFFPEENPALLAELVRRFLRER